MEMTRGGTQSYILLDPGALAAGLEVKGLV